MWYTWAIVLLTSLGATNAQEADKQCMWGPSYWCSSVKSAKTCGSVQFCIRNTWKTAAFVQDLHDDNTCTFCQKLVTDIRDYVTADQSEQVIIAYADKACAALSDKFIADECKGIANMYIVQIIQMLRQNMDPKAVCRTLNLCATADLFISQKNYRPYFAVSQETLTRLAVDKLKTAKVPDVFRILARNTASYGGSRTETTLRAFTGSADDQCSTCKQGVEDLKIVFNNAQVRTEVAQILKSNLCPRFIIPAECNKLIDEYAPEVFQVLMNLDPLAACETIGLCGNKKPSVMPMVAIKPAIRVEQPISANKPIKASVQCVLCEYVMTTVMQDLQDNATDQKVIDTVTHICQVMPSTVKAECQQFIQQYGQELIDLLTHSTDPQTICTLIGLCSNNNAESTMVDSTDDRINLHPAIKSFINIGPVINGFAEESDKKRVSADSKCYMCRIVANYLISILNENYTAQAVEKGLDKVCNFLPGDLSAECEQFVDQYTTQLLAVIMSSLNTQEICQAIEMCPPASSTIQQATKVVEELILQPINY